MTSSVPKILVLHFLDRNEYQRMGVHKGMRRTRFAERVLAIVGRIPYGKTLTYQEVARRAGSPRAFRAVGNILNRYDPRVITVPCHRVVRSDGSVGGYRWGTKKKIALLRKEKALS